MNGSTFDGQDSPGLDCFAYGHMWANVTRAGFLWLRMKNMLDRWPPDDQPAAVSWCLWCATATYDAAIDPYKLKVVP